MFKVAALFTLAALAAIARPALADSITRPAENKSKAPLKIQPQAYAFGLQDVRLLPGSEFHHAQELDRKWLRELDADRMLHNFRLTAGLPSDAKPLGGWEEPKCELRGHAVGHYLTAVALAWASCGDEELKAKGERIVAGMAECQAKVGTGYLSAFPESWIDRVETGQRVWAPWYTLHKIYAGLIDMYVYCDNDQALEVARKFADWYVKRSARLSEPQFQKMLANEHGGMNDCLAELYAVTGEQKYLDLSRRFNHKAVLDPLAAGEDRLTGLHANTQFPKVIGCCRQHELTGEESLKKLSVFFWEVVTRERSYAIGGNSDGEHFSPKERLSQHIGPSTTETCNTYNMLKLTRHLMSWQMKCEYGDYYERALYNHILASQNPRTGMVCYYIPLRSGQAKTYSSVNDAFWCCVGTGIENHVKYGDSIYFHDGAGKNLYLNLFIPSTLNWKDAGVQVRQETRFPDDPSTSLRVSCAKPRRFTLHVRCPYWATAGITADLNGERLAFEGKPGSYVAIDRTWSDGDTLRLIMPFTLRTEGFRDNPRKVALMFGPLVLAAETPAGRTDTYILGEVEKIPSALAKVAEPGQPWALTFAGSKDVFRVGGEEPRDLIFRPYYRIHDKPQAVYWDVLTAEEYTRRQEAARAEQARRRALKARTVDEVEIGRAESEKAHALKGDKTGTGVFNSRRWRHATDGGWFSYELKVPGDAASEVMVTYWGGDGGNRTFDVLIDDKKVATVKLEHNKPGEFFDACYSVPADRAGQQKITVRFQAQPGKWAGGVFGVAVLKKN